MQQPKKPAPPPGFVPMRAQSGRLLGYIDPQRRIVEIKRKGEKPETINLADYLPS